MGDEVELYDESRAMTREEAARRLHEIADELGSNNSVRVVRDGKHLVVAVPDRVEFGLEVEQEGDEMELDIEISWKGAPIAT